MKLKYKPALILLITLIIGFVICGLTTVTIIRYKVLSFATEEGFNKVVYDFFDPDKEQEVKLEPLVDKYAKQYDQIKNTFIVQFIDVADSFLIEIDPILNEDQKEKAHDGLQEFEKRINDIVEKK